MKALLSICALFFLLIILTACEYEYYYSYVVVNETNQTFEADITTVVNSSTVTIESNNTQKIFQFSGGVSGKNFEPGDRRNFRWELDSLFIMTTDTKRSRNLADRIFGPLNREIETGHIN